MRSVDSNLQAILDAPGAETHTTLEVARTDSSVRRFATHSLNIGGDAYADDLVFADEISDSINSKTDRLEVTLANADKAVGLDVAAALYDLADASLRRYFRNLSTGNVIHRDIFFGKLIPIGYNEREARFELVDAMVAAGYVVANWTLEENCQLVFKAPECGYTGPETTCNKIWKSKGGCAGRANTHRLVGTPFPFAKIVTSPTAPQIPIGQWPGTHCFPPDTLVTMADGGRKRIKDIGVGDMVVAVGTDLRMYPARVTETFESRVQKHNMREVRFDLGRIVAQGRHRVLVTPEPGLVAPTFISIKDDLTTRHYGSYVSGQSVTLNRVKSIRLLEPQEIDFEFVYNLTVEVHHSYIANGIPVSNLKYPDDIEQPGTY